MIKIGYFLFGGLLIIGVCLGFFLLANTNITYRFIGLIIGIIIGIVSIIKGIKEA